jgi:hypothetical protein
MPFHCVKLTFNMALSRAMDMLNIKMTSCILTILVNVVSLLCIVTANVYQLGGQQSRFHLVYSCTATPLFHGEFHLHWHLCRHYRQILSSSYRLDIYPDRVYISSNSLLYSSSFSGTEMSFYTTPHQFIHHHQSRSCLLSILHIASSRRVIVIVNQFFCKERI